jgi:hypothetical protein
MSTVNLVVSALIQGLVQGANGVAPPVQNLAASAALSLTTGTTANKADGVYSATRTLAASANESLDLAGGLEDAFGNTLTFVDVVAVLIVASAANTNDVLVGGAASNGWASPFGDATDVVKVRPGGFFVLAAGKDPAYAVTAATGDLLKIANSAGGSSVSYDIVVIGRSA